MCAFSRSTAAARAGPRGTEKTRASISRHSCVQRLATLWIGSPSSLLTVSTPPACVA